MGLDKIFGSWKQSSKEPHVHTVKVGQEVEMTAELFEAESIDSHRGQHMHIPSGTKGEVKRLFDDGRIDVTFKLDDGPYPAFVTEKEIK